MWPAFTRHTVALVALVAATAVAGCGDRRLDLSITDDATGCTLDVPAGGSVLYQLEAIGTTTTGGGSFCGGCLAVTTPIADAGALVAFLRAQAPACAGVHPGTIIGVRITGWSAGGCPRTPPSFCADGPTQLVPDGTSDGTVTLPLTCNAACSATCVPTTCMAQGKNCGAISDGCNNVLQCGTCHPPQRCGADNVCAK
jgi:hypothetical protein